MDEPTKGAIHFKQQDIRNIIPHQLRRQIALGFQTPVFFPKTVLENLQLVHQISGCIVQPNPFYQERLEEVGLPGTLLSQSALQLSAGEKQRLAIVRLLLNQPNILLLDEPISALDPISADLLLKAIQHLNRQFQITVLLVTHQQEPLKIGTRQWEIREGQLVRDEPLPVKSEETI